jgi:hypothetical protein
MNDMIEAYKIALKAAAVSLDTWMMFLHYSKADHHVWRS